MLLLTRKETTKYMVRVHADDTEQCFVSFGGDRGPTVSTRMFRMEEPPAFHTVYKRFDLVSFLYAGKPPPCRGCVHGAGQ